MAPFVHASAEVHATAKLGPGVKIWNSAQVREGAVLGEHTSVGKGAFVDLTVSIGANCKIQNGVNIYHGAVIEDGVFLGPGAMLLNDKAPRAVNPDGSRKSASDWTVAGVRVRRGAAVGGGAILAPGVTIGQWAMVGAGAVVVKDVPDHGLVVGNPAALIGYVAPSGERLAPVETADGRRRWVSPDGFEFEPEDDARSDLVAGARA